jgi:hypothetical protein
LEDRFSLAATFWPNLHGDADEDMMVTGQVVENPAKHGALAGQLIGNYET